MDGAHAAVVAGVHRLQHVEGLGAAALAEDDAVGPHAQRVADQVALGDLAAALQVGRPGLQPDDMRLLQLQLGRVLDRDDALAGVDQPAHGVQQRGLAGAGAAGDDDVQPAARGDLQHPGHRPASARRSRPAGRSRCCRRANLRIDRQGPSSASGGKTMLTRLPSASRASTIGLLSSIRRPIAGGDALGDVGQVLVVAEADARTARPCRAARRRPGRGPFTMMSVMVSSSSSGSSGPRPSMSSTRSSASWRCSRAFSCRRCSVGDLGEQPLDLGGEPLGRHAGDGGGVDAGRGRGRAARPAARQAVGGRRRGARQRPAAAGRGAGAPGRRRSAGGGGRSCGARLGAHRRNQRGRPGARRRPWPVPPAACASWLDRVAEGAGPCRPAGSPRVAASLQALRQVRDDDVGLQLQRLGHLPRSAARPCGRRGSAPAGAGGLARPGRQLQQPQRVAHAGQGRLQHQDALLREVEQGAAERRRPRSGASATMKL